MPVPFSPHKINCTCPLFLNVWQCISGILVPVVENIRLLFFIASTISLVYYREAMRLIKGTSLFISLKSPER